jgi:hypothetical protein
LKFQILRRQKGEQVSQGKVSIRPYLKKKTKSEKDWEHGLSGKVFV